MKLHELLLIRNLTPIAYAIDVSIQSDANTSITVIDTAIETVYEERSKIG